MSSKLVIAAAGSGKTTYLVQEALKITNQKVLITTYTESNEREIRAKFLETAGCIPPNITILTWFSFLIQQGIKPYQGYLYPHEVTGLLLVNQRSGLLYIYKGRPVYASEADIDKHYFTKDGHVYSDKISKFVCKLNEANNGLTIDRISRVYNYIFIDEVQDLAGYDLELIQLFFHSNVSLLMVGDPRQVTFHTHEEAKNSKYSEGQLEQFIRDRNLDIEIDKSTLNITYRNEKSICEYANSIYPNFSPCIAASKEPTGHDGVFFVRATDIDAYLKDYHPVQLRDSKRTAVNTDHPVFNFGDSKGLTFNRTLIYPTTPMIKWIFDHGIDLKPKSRARFYVAVTRAKYSAAIVINDIKKRPPGIMEWKNN